MQYKKQSCRCIVWPTEQPKQQELVTFWQNNINLRLIWFYYGTVHVHGLGEVVVLFCYKAKSR